LKTAAWPLPGTHHLISHDGRVFGLPHFEAPHRTDQLLQLAMIGFDDIVRIPALPMHCLFRTSAFGREKHAPSRSKDGW